MDEEINLLGQRDSLRARLFQGLTQREIGEGGGVRDMLMAIGGSSTRTSSGIDLASAADTLGVSRRTVQRWVAASDTGRGHPSPANMAALTKAARQTYTTAPGRRRAAQQSGVAERFAGGAKVTFSGVQGPTADTSYHRDRSTTVEVGPEEARDMIGAWERNGDKGFMQWASNHYGEKYVGDWQFDTVADFQITPWQQP